MEKVYQRWTGFVGARLLVVEKVVSTGEVNRCNLAGLEACGEDSFQLGVDGLNGRC
jgi:hypothetical protein